MWPHIWLLRRVEGSFSVSFINKHAPVMTGMWLAMSKPFVLTWCVMTTKRHKRKGASPCSVNHNVHFIIWMSKPNFDGVGNVVLNINKKRLQCFANHAQSILHWRHSKGKIFNVLINLFGFLGLFFANNHWHRIYWLQLVPKTLGQVAKKKSNKCLENGPMKTSHMPSCDTPKKAKDFRQNMKNK